MAEGDYTNAKDFMAWVDPILGSPKEIDYEDLVFYVQNFSTKDDDGDIVFGTIDQMDMNTIHDEIQEGADERIQAFLKADISALKEEEVKFIEYYYTNIIKASPTKSIKKYDNEEKEKLEIQISQGKTATSAAGGEKKEDFVKFVKQKTSDKLKTVEFSSKANGLLWKPADIANAALAKDWGGWLSVVISVTTLTKDASDLKAWIEENPGQAEEYFPGVTGSGLTQSQKIKAPAEVNKFDLKVDSNEPVPFQTSIDEWYEKYKAAMRKRAEEKDTTQTNQMILDEHVNGCVDSFIEQLAIKLTNEYRAWLAYKIIDRDDPEAPLTADDLAEAQKNTNEDMKAAGMGDVAEPDPQLTEEDIKKRQKFFKQCALLMAMKYFKDDYRKLIASETSAGEDDETADNYVHFGGKPFGGRFWMVGDETGAPPDNSGILNKLFTTKQMGAFMNVTPDILAMLVPKIRLYKVVSNGDKLIEVEFDFEQKTDRSRIDAIGDSNFDRGDGAGIKEFSFSFEGTSPATAKNDIKAKLSLYFQNFQDFFNCRESKTSLDSNGDGYWYRYVDMILFPGANDCPGQAATDDSENKKKKGYGTISRFQNDPSYYRIRADVGWVIPDDAATKAELNRRGASYADDLIKALQLTNKTFFLNMVDHDIDIRQDGTVTINIDYRAYIESALKTSRFDALSTREIVKTREARELDMIEASQKCTPEQMVQVQKAFQVEDELLAQNAHQSIIKRLMARNKIFFLEIDKTSADEYRTNGFFSTEPQFVLNPDEPDTTGEDPTAKAGVQEAEEGVSYNYVSNILYDRKLSDDTTVNYFFMGDLIHVILDTCFDETTNKPLIENTKFLLSSFDVHDFDGLPYSVNIAEIPIAVEYFFEWMTHYVLSDGRTSYPVLYFIKQLCNRLIVEMMGDICRNKEIVKKLFFDTAVFSGVSTDNVDPFAEMVSSSNVIINTTAKYAEGKLPVRGDRGMEEVQINDFYNYLMIYPSFITYKAVGVGDEDKDLERGVYHLHIGSRAGIVKNIKFSKTDMQFIREARFINQGIDGLLQLGAVYKTTIEMIGNTIFYPGMEVYIDPIGIGGYTWDPTEPSSIANKLGFGGYHIITGVNSTITSGKFATTVEAQWHYPGDGTNYRWENKSVKQDSSDISEQTDEDKQRCIEIIATHELSNDQLAQEQNDLEKDNGGGGDPANDGAEQAEQTEADAQPDNTSWDVVY